MRSEQSKLNDLLTLQLDPYGSDEVLDAVERLVDAGEEERVDKILDERWIREKPANGKEKPANRNGDGWNGSMVKGVKKTKVWTGLKQSSGQRKKEKEDEREE